MPCKLSVQIGDIIEISTRKGLCYALYSHDDPNPKGHGTLIRVLEGFSSQRLTDAALILQRRELFATFTLLRHYVESGEITVVGHIAPLPLEFREFPTLRCDPRCRDGTVRLWNGTQEWRAALTDAQEGLSIREIVDIVALKEYLEKQWRPGPGDIIKLPPIPKST